MLFSTLSSLHQGKMWLRPCQCALATSHPWQKNHILHLSNGHLLSGTRLSLREKRITSKGETSGHGPADRTFLKMVVSAQHFHEATTEIFHRNFHVQGISGQFGFESSAVSRPQQVSFRKLRPKIKGYLTWNGLQGSPSANSIGAETDFQLYDWPPFEPSEVRHVATR